MKAVIIMGSKKDLDHSIKIAKKLKEFGIDSEIKIASAHKTPLKVLKILREYENEEVVFITVAGRSDALSGFVDANTSKPVVACPPPANLIYDLFSTIRMPSDVAPMLVLNPENAALAAAKIFALIDGEVRRKILKYKEKKRKEIEDAVI